MENAVIVAGARTAFGSFGGSLKTVSPTDLVAHVIPEVLTRAGIGADQLDAVVIGQVLTRTDENNLVARGGALQAGVPDTVPCHCTIRGCGSGMEAIHAGCRQIMLGEDQIILAGGVDNMSMAPYLTKDARFGLRMRDTVLTDSLWEVLKDPTTDLMMGMTAENIASKFGISREDQDEHALLSNQRALTAIRDGKLKQQITPIEVKSRKGSFVFDTDEHPKDTTLEQLAGLPPAFKKDGGSVTAGNASGINDGCAAVVVMAESKAREMGIKPIAKVLSFATAAVDPAYMGMGPVPASRKALERAGMKVEDVDAWEVNEAFSAQYIYCERELGVDRENANVWGGAVAYGHPVGASGARVLINVLEVLRDRDRSTGLATLCIGGGQGIATVVERL
ncbi:MAG: thiolase family protein [Actinobacteria bacterium]|nr:thiolase family protein [Actinomycetota bacterium]MBU1942199.1 thiolase family protein [Actinomycetota bacterium]MBU2688036.1 thiolase family protein [Actinomycetota bacterium]